MVRTRRSFIKEFKLSTVAELEAGASVAEVARRRSLHADLVYQWYKAYRTKGADAFPDKAGSSGPQDPQAAKIAELERMIGRLRGHHIAKRTRSCVVSVALSHNIKHLMGHSLQREPVYPVSELSLQTRLRASHRGDSECENANKHQGSGVEKGSFHLFLVSTQTLQEMIDLKCDKAQSTGQHTPPTSSQNLNVFIRNAWSGMAFASPSTHSPPSADRSLGVSQSDLLFNSIYQRIQLSREARDGFRQHVVEVALRLPRPSPWDSVAQGKV